MSRDDRAAVHAALGDLARLEMVDLLMVGDLSVQELSRALDMPGNLLAHHLNVLAAAQVITRVRSEGDGRRRYVKLQRHVFEDLWQRLPVPESVVFVCSHNSARSQYAAAYFHRQVGRPSISAGANPAKEVHPLAIKVAAERGVDLSAATPSGYDTIAPMPEMLVSVCDRAREADLPDAQRRVHWSVPDPVAVGTMAAFRAAFDEIETRVDALK